MLVLHSAGLGLEGVVRPSLVSLCSGEVEGTLLERQRTWEAARELKLRHARALKELSTLVVRPLDQKHIRR
jgi:hypothetical protein